MIQGCLEQLVASTSPARRVPAASRLSASGQSHDNADGGADEQEKAHHSLDEEAGQPLLDRLAVADEVDGSTHDPNKAEDCRRDVAQIDCTKPQRHQKGRHPFEHVHMRAEDAFEIGIAGRSWMSDTDIATRRRHASSKKEVERYSEQCDDGGVVRHDGILRCSMTNVELSFIRYTSFTEAAAVRAHQTNIDRVTLVNTKILRVAAERSVDRTAATSLDYSAVRRLAFIANCGRGPVPRGLRDLCKSNLRELWTGELQPRNPPQNGSF
jgi:hypothetical protein